MDIPTIDQIKVGEDYQDLTASIKVLTNRTDIVDTVYKGYAEDFMKVYPNITVTYEGITDYEESLNLRLTNGDWGDLCFIPTSVNKNELSSYFTALGSRNFPPHRMSSSTVCSRSRTIRMWKRRCTQTFPQDGPWAPGMLTSALRLLAIRIS